jgi:HD-GYP domain-containing protein (c-di-GMP phosphodiesterase class II)
VVDYINEHFLYAKERLLSQLKGDLFRYQHSLNSSEVAYKLACRQGLKKKTCKEIKFATFFHDVTKS